MEPFRPVIGVTVGWSLKPCLCFEGGYVLPTGFDRQLYPQYYQDGDWPTDPVTHEKLPIADTTNNGRKRK